MERYQEIMVALLESAMKNGVKRPCLGTDDDVISSWQ